MTHILIQQAFELFEKRGVSGTQHVVLSEHAAANFAELIRTLDVQPQKLLVLHDPITFEVAAREIITSLERAGWSTLDYCCDTPNGTPPACTDSYVAGVIADLRDVSFDRVLAVGSGTITDVGKLVAQSRGIDMISFATAPSMNGYTSKIAAILKDGVKQTVPCIAPQICIADPAILAAAPQTMIGAGAGDAYSRFVAKSDWKLSHLLHDATYDPLLAQLLTEASTLLRTVPGEIVSDPQEAITNLSVVLYVTGLAQQAALPGTQASGGEHLVSHYLDMLAGHPDFSHTSDLHGRQVAVGTIITAHLYEALGSVDLHALPIDDLVASHRTPDELSKHLQQHFRGLAKPVIKRALANYPTRPELRARLREYQFSDLDLQSDVMNPWLDADMLTAELRACGAPTTFAEIGVSSRLRADTVTHCRHVRDRFTCLHLASELYPNNDALLEIAEKM